jgi:hypothetical protein
VPVAKARPALADAEALWQRAFEAAFDLGDAVCRPLWVNDPPSPVQHLYDVIVPDVCNSPAHYLRERPDGWDPDAEAARSGKLACLDDLLAAITERREAALIFTSYDEGSQ